jgi:hypothetical protein
MSAPATKPLFLPLANTIARHSGSRSTASKTLSNSAAKLASSVLTGLPGTSKNTTRTPPSRVSTRSAFSVAPGLAVSGLVVPGPAAPELAVLFAPR